LERGSYLQFIFIFEYFNTTLNNPPLYGSMPMDSRSGDRHGCIAPGKKPIARESNVVNNRKFDVTFA
jgi:hypothetical protein